MTCNRLPMATATNRDAGAVISVQANEPLRYAERSAPIDPDDSGWQFSSVPLGGGDPTNAQIWWVREILNREPSLERFIDLPIGTILYRSIASNEWQVAPSQSREPSIC